MSKYAWERGDCWTEDERFGYFIGDVDTRWLHERGQSRQMLLLAPFVYVDPRGVEWLAPKAAIIDGSSIPRLFWRLRDPFIGDHRFASVPHDVWCKRRGRPRADVHRMYYNAMRAAGEPTAVALVMGQAVSSFGPRWGPNSEGAA